MSPKELDELAREVGGRLVPDTDEMQIITADEVFADLSEDDASRSADLDEDDLIRSDEDDEPDDDLEDELEDEEGEDVEDELDDEALDGLAADAEALEAELDEDEAERSVYPDNDSILRAMDPDGDEFRKYWTRGKGLRKWLGRPREWTALKNHLRKYVGEERAKRIASQWFHLVKGFWPGSDLHRVEKGKPPRGSRVGPG